MSFDRYNKWSLLALLGLLAGSPAQRVAAAARVALEGQPDHWRKPRYPTGVSQILELALETGLQQSAIVDEKHVVAVPVLGPGGMILGLHVWIGSTPPATDPPPAGGFTYDPGVVQLEQTVECSVMFRGTPATHTALAGTTTFTQPVEYINDVPSLIRVVHNPSKGERAILAISVRDALHDARMPWLAILHGAGCKTYGILYDQTPFGIPAPRSSDIDRAARELAEQAGATYAIGIVQPGLETGRLRVGIFLTRPHPLLADVAPAHDPYHHIHTDDAHHIACLIAKDTAANGQYTGRMRGADGTSWIPVTISWSPYYSEDQRLNHVVVLHIAICS